MNRLENAKIAAALATKKKLLEQSIESWTDITILVDHITEIDTHLESIFSAGSNTSIRVSDEFSIEKERLQKEWHQKTEAIGQLQMIHDAIGVLRNKLTGNPQLSELIFLNAEIDSLSQQCINVVDISVINLRNRYLKEIEEELRTAITESFSRAEQRIIELSVVGETDVQLAVDILQDYEKEAQEILSDDPRFLGLVVAIKEAQKTLKAKMDLFTGLQHFYDTLDTIKRENKQWNTITSQQ
ncbi:unnamed protein product, partial [Brugia pahangi]|uniref:Nsp1_C domain-containing protein n=1 Tax=Brugia pahangi TaxID=6280 RepID=A0A0N4T6D4_BRUPA